MNGFNLSDITDAKLGATTLSGGIYLGSTKLWPLGTDYSKEYFTIEALENTTISLHKNTTSGKKRTVAFSRNGKIWSRLVTQGDRLDYEYDNVELTAGEKIYIKADDWLNVTTSDYAYFTSNGNINVYGNVNSIIDRDFKTRNIMRNYMFYKLFNKLPIVDASNLVLPSTPGNYSYQSMFENCAQLVYPPKTLSGTEVGDYGCSYMFSGCTSLKTAPELPATTLATYCYYNMFYGCTSLATAPVLPATTLANSCYGYMFEGCSSLTTAPELPATTLANSCYMSMFAGTKITAAPELPATILTDSCYRNMFYGCASLRYPPTLNATILQPRCYQHMFYGCTSLKTAPVLPATTLATYCYAYMFQNCTSLSYIKCLATNISASNSHDWWLYKVASTGTFVKPKSMYSWPANAHGIPSGWKVVNV